MTIDDHDHDHHRWVFCTATGGFQTPSCETGQIPVMRMTDEDEQEMLNPIAMFLKE